MTPQLLSTKDADWDVERRAFSILID